MTGVVVFVIVRDYKKITRIGSMFLMNDRFKLLLRFSVLTLFIIVIICCERNNSFYNNKGELIKSNYVKEDKKIELKQLEIESDFFIEDSEIIADLIKLNINNKISLDYSPKTGIFYLADEKDSQLIVMDEKGNIIERYGNYGFGPGEFNHPEDVCVKNDKMFVADTMNIRISVFDISCNEISYIKSIPLHNRPHKVAVDNNLNIYVISGMPLGPLIHKYSYEGNYLISFGDRKPAYLNKISELTTAASDICIDSNDNIFFTYVHYYLIRKYSKEGYLIDAYEGYLGISELTLKALNNSDRFRARILSNIKCINNKLIIPIVGPLPFKGIDKYSIDIFDIKKIAIKKIYIPEKVYLDTVFLINSNLYLFDFGREMKIFRKRINND